MVLEQDKEPDLSASGTNNHVHVKAGLCAWLAIIVL